METERLLTRIDEIRTYVTQELITAGITIPRKTPLSCRSAEGQRLSAYFDHTLLKPEADLYAFDKLCTEAVLWKTCSVCVPPNRVPWVVDRLRGTGVKTCTVIGFPLGYSEGKSKAEEVRLGREAGCEEFDTVIPIGFLKDGNIPAVFKDLCWVVEAAEGRLVKVILETCLLSEEEILLGGTLALLAGADMLKTSTGFSAGGATVEVVKLLRILAGREHGVKAAGGIRDYPTVLAMIEAGADRIGASATELILSQAEERGKER
ncbi:MAG: deoxyribose-phosphate aldolase [Spirochaetales bacterium]|nr:deoxyribose-phosphate aldolase [Spirochaetales bacterium]